MNHTTDSTSAPYYFISYCRQEVTFADSFSRELEKRGIRTWVDFRNLVPGRPWQHQLDEGVHNAKTILLVVSKASMASLPVKDEWTKSLAKGKRIILILFEPCKLDPGLTGLAWVDFTKPFDKAMSKLIGLLARSTQPAPSTLLQKWMHLPSSVMVFAFLSLLLALLCVINIPLAIYSVFAVVSVVSTISSTHMLYDSIRFYSLFFIWLPTILYFSWLPIQMFRRTHNAQKIRNTLNALFFSGLLLVTLPVILYFQDIIENSSTSAFFDDFLLIIGVNAVNLIIIVICLYLNRLLVSNEMYRWSGPNGVLVRNRPVDLTGYIDNGAHMRVAVEYAPQDRLYAQELKASIRKAGHFYTDHVHSADIVLSLLSVYKTGSAYNPETTRLIPTLIQFCQVDQELARTQWIDLRHGKGSMDALAHSLQEPTELLRILGVLPVRTIILPNAVKWLIILLSFFMTTLLVLTVLNVGIIYFRAGMSPENFRYLINSVVLVLGVYCLRRYIINRKLRYFPFISYRWTVGFAILIALLAMFSPGFSPLGWPLLLIPLLMLHKDVRLWLPVSTKKRFRDRQRSEVQPATSQ